MIKIEKKTIYMVSAAAICIFLFIHYWSGISAFLSTAYQALVPVIAGAVMAYMLNILMSFYERIYFKKHNNKFAQKTRKPACLIGAVFTVLLIIALITWLVIPELVKCITEIVKKVPIAITKLFENETIKRFLPASAYDWIENFGEKLSGLNWSNIIKNAANFLKGGFSSYTGKIVDAVSYVASSIFASVVAIIFTFYFIGDKDRVIRGFNKASIHIFKADKLERIKHYCSLLNQCFHKYIVAQCLEALILGSLCFIGMTIFRFPYASMISALVSVMALIPLIGATISAIVGTLMILSTDPLKALFFLIFLMTLHVIEGNLIYPKVVGKQVGTPSLIVLFAVTVGGSIFGIVGMLISVPIATAAYVEYNAYIKRKDEAKLAEAEPKE